MTKKYNIIPYFDNNFEKEQTIETNLDEFFQDLFALYEKYNISIACEDRSDAFILQKNSRYNRKWILDAYVRDYLDLSEDFYVYPAE